MVSASQYTTRRIHAQPVDQEYGQPARNRPLVGELEEEEQREKNCQHTAKIAGGFADGKQLDRRSRHFQPAEHEAGGGGYQRGKGCRTRRSRLIQTMRHQPRGQHAARSEEATACEGNAGRIGLITRRDRFENRGIHDAGCDARNEEHERLVPGAGGRLRKRQHEQYQRPAKASRAEQMLQRVLSAQADGKD